MSGNRHNAQFVKNLVIQFSSCVHGVHIKEKGGPKDNYGTDGFQLPRRKQWRPKGAKLVNTKGTSESSNGNKDSEASKSDTLTGMGCIKKVINDTNVGLSPPMVTDPTIPTAGVMANSLGGPKVGERPIKEGKASVNDVAKQQGEFCTVNAGRTPCSKDGPDNGKDDLQRDTILVQSVVHSFKSLTKPKRGQFVSHNSFTLLNYEETSDEDDMEIIETNTSCQREGEVTSTISEESVDLGSKELGEANLSPSLK